MRKPEITNTLIELSKRAKELGFPQDVEEGDWVYGIETEHGETGVFMVVSKYPCSEHEGSVDYIVHNYIPTDEEAMYSSFTLCEKQDDVTLILSFSICLAWLRERRWWLVHLEDARPPNLGWLLQMSKQYKSKDYKLEYGGQTHHEAITRAVCKVLEGE